jgi:molybdate transport system substrate-binding protein
MGRPSAQAGSCDDFWWLHRSVRSACALFRSGIGHTRADRTWPFNGRCAHAIPNRLARGEAADVVILAGSALDELIGQGKIIPGSKADPAQSLVAVAVKEGTPLPNMLTTSELAKVLLAARSIAVSASASGVYVSSELVNTLGIEN